MCDGASFQSQEKTKIKLAKVISPFQSHFKEGFAKMIHEIYYCYLEFDADCIKI